MAVEESSLDGSRLLAYLPGAILVNKEPLDGSPWPDVSPNRVTRAVLAAVYGVLQVRHEPDGKRFRFYMTQDSREYIDGMMQETMRAQVGRIPVIF